ncbi:uncharacterized protein [Spinacia oleracea]|uniref:dUTP diphosphatase n=1 Tax=Spinacia oleracea TaxID=3562 RepID=A0ABM3R4J2_SPIOL|nr:uncharacterized protein LOC110792894 [Spinacia oleracea]
MAPKAEKKLTEKKKPAEEKKTTAAAEKDPTEKKKKKKKKKGGEEGLRRRRERAAVEKDPAEKKKKGGEEGCRRCRLAWNHSIDVGAGVIDADYRGPVKIGDCIAQLIIEKIITPDVFEVEDLDSTVRGAGGFGSTGV